MLHLSVIISLVAGIDFLYSIGFGHRLSQKRRGADLTDQPLAYNHINSVLEVDSHRDIHDGIAAEEGVHLPTSVEPKKIAQ